MTDITEKIPRTNVLGVGVSAINMDDAVKILLAACASGKTGYVCVTGVHGVIESQRDSELISIHNQSFLTVPDGMPTVWMGKEQGFVHMGRVYGPDLMLAVCEQSVGALKPLNVKTERSSSLNETASDELNEGSVRLNETSGENQALGTGREALGREGERRTEAATSDPQRSDVSGQVSEGKELTSDLRSPISNRKCYTHFLYGSTPETLSKLKANLEAKFPGIQIVGTYSPPFRPLNEEEELELQKVVAACKPDFFWVGLSTPKQERFMAQHDPRNLDLVETARSASLNVENVKADFFASDKSAAFGNDLNDLNESGTRFNEDSVRLNAAIGRYPLNCGIMLGVGAAFDIHAGLLKDAPEWVKSSGLQWLYRLCQEPTRLWRRYLDIVPRFLWLAFLQLLGIRKYSIEE